jgi:superfamily I DNA/RNA helicase/RecB family exonuclease
VRRPAPPAAAAPTPDVTQRRAVAHAAGPLLVLGGPGTGKTTTLVESVAARVADGVDPTRILVLAFNRRIAARLRHDLALRLAGGTAGGRTGAPDRSGLRVTAEPLVRTFHGYAFGLLRRAAAEAGQPTPRLLTAPEQDLVIRELLVGADFGWPEDLAAALRTRAFAEQLRDLLLRAAERGVDEDGLSRLGVAAHRPEWTAAARFLAGYEQVLALREATGRTGAGYDAAELVRAATGLLATDAGLLATHREEITHVFVDDLADTDPAQLDLLELLAGSGRHLVAFADPDSSTFGFRGADPRGVLDFPDRFRAPGGGPAPTLTLLRCHRSGANLVAATRRVAARLRGPARHRALLPAGDLPPGEVHTATFRSTSASAGYVAHRLRTAHLVDGVPWSRMAVLVRSATLQVPALQRALHTAGVPAVVHGDDVPLHLRPAVAPLLLAIRVALAPSELDEQAAVALLHSPLGGADPLAERRLRQGLRAVALAGGDRRPSGPLLVEALRDPRDLVAVQRRWAAPARAVAQLLATIGRAARRPGATAEDVLWAAWEATGLATRWAAESARGGPRGAAADRDLDTVLALFDAAARFTDRLPGAGIAVFLDYLTGQDVPGESLAPVAERGQAVHLLTAHAAKGGEYDVVVVANVQEGLWHDLRPRGTVLGSEHLVDLLAGRAGAGDPAAALSGQAAARLDEERRLFYVAATRARRHLVVTAVDSADGDEQPSRFVGELAAAAEPDAAAGEAIERPPRALTLAALVAELRTAVADPAAPATRRAAAATQLARLAAAGVPGADPDEWWGLRALSDERPLSDPGDPVLVSPSTVEAISRCSLRWLLERHGGGAAPTPEQGVGNLVHAAAMLTADVGVDRAALVDYVAERFDEIELSARWLAGRERDRAEQMIDRLVGWLAGNPRRVAAIEREFLVMLTQDVGIRGQVDRLEIDERGRLVVIDIKTGRSTSVTEAGMATHGQLGAYQAAVEAGAFDDLGTEPGGAALVQLGTPQVKEQRQPALGESGDPGWAERMVRRTAQTMAAATFEAVANSRCRTCPVRTSCPVSGRGRQVTEQR